MNPYVGIMEPCLGMVEDFDMELQVQEIVNLEEDIHLRRLMVNDYDDDVMS